MALHAEVFPDGRRAADCSGLVGAHSCRARAPFLSSDVGILRRSRKEGMQGLRSVFMQAEQMRWLESLQEMHD